MKGIGIGERRGRRYLNLALTILLLVSVVLTLVPTTVQAKPSLQTGCTGTCQCVDYAKAKRPDLSFISVQYAKDWGTAALANKYSVDSTPKAGDIVVFQPGAYGSDTTAGHVAYVDSVNSNGTFNISEKGYCNIPSGGTWADKCTVHTRTNLIVISGVSFIHQPGVCTIQPGDGSSRASLFRDAYIRNGGLPNIGCPVNTAHGWTNGMVIQDFPRTTTFGLSAIIHYERGDTPTGSVPAYVIHGGIWEKYIALGGDNSNLGPPTSDEFTNAAGKRQTNFRSGYITWNGSAWQEYYWASCNTNKTNTWRVEFHNGKNLDAGPTWVSCVPFGSANKLSYDKWSTGAPDGGKTGIWLDHFALRATTTTTFPAGTYRFTASVDDGVRLSVCGTTIIDKWTKANTIYTIDKSFSATTSCQVTVDYFEETEAARLIVNWVKK